MLGEAVPDLISPNPARLLTLGEPVLPFESVLTDVLALGDAALSVLPVRPHLLALGHAHLGLVT